jgi:hypothetical protein
MKRTTSIRVTIAVIAVLLSPALGAVAYAQTPASQTNSMSIWQARRTLAAKLKTYENVETSWNIPLRFSADGFEFDKKNSKKGQETVNIDLRVAPVVKATCPNACKITDESGKSFSNNIDPELRWVLGYWQWRDLSTDAKGHKTSKSCRSADCRQAAESSAVAFNVLRSFAIDANSPLRNFAQRSAAWRALATKPPIPEEVKVQRLMAEDAVQRNKPDEALNYYENGIQLYPTWPEGNFNAALIAGELGYYADAIEHMQDYLDLVPNAPDAQAARDKMTIWQVKARQ